MRMPRHCFMSSARVTTMGMGHHLSLGSGAMAMTASTSLFSSSRSAKRVVMPVHCAPSNGFFKRALYKF